MRNLRETSVFWMMSVAYHKVRNYSCAPGIAIDGSTSALGQTEKNSVRAYVFRFALELGHRSMLRRNPFRPFLADFIEARVRLRERRHIKWSIASRFLPYTPD